MKWLCECLLINQVFVFFVDAFQNDFGSFLAETNETLFPAPNGAKNVLTSSKNNYMYMYRKPNQPSNYLNYRALYGLRYNYPPKQVNVKNDDADSSVENYVSINFNLEEPKSEQNSDVDVDKLQVGNDTNNNNINEAELSNSEDAEESKIFENLFQNLSLSTADKRNETVEEDNDNQHIMKPTNRVENALNFLAQRLKKLIYLSSDESRPESKFSPHLSTFGRFLSLFSAIRFENFPCIAGRRPLRQLSGTCYNELECLQFGKSEDDICILLFFQFHFIYYEGGIALDRCANGLGVCCVFRAGCSSFSHQNVTYFESPHYPNATSVNLELSVNLNARWLEPSDISHESLLFLIAFDSILCVVAASPCTSHIEYGKYGSISQDLNCYHRPKETVLMTDFTCQVMRETSMFQCSAVLGMVSTVSLL